MGINFLVSGVCPKHKRLLSQKHLQPLRAWAEINLYKCWHFSVRETFSFPPLANAVRVENELVCTESLCRALGGRYGNHPIYSYAYLWDVNRHSFLTSTMSILVSPSLRIISSAILHKGQVNFSWFYSPIWTVELDRGQVTDAFFSVQREWALRMLHGII